MNYSKGNIKKRLEELRSNSRRRANRVSMFLTHMAIIGLIGAIIIGTSAGYGAFQGIKNSTPNVKVTDIIPKGYYSVVLNSDGEQIAKLVSTDSNRVPVDSVPKMLANAFVAIEDERFYSHNGIDIYGIARAAFIGLTSGGKFSEGASTITQQLIKNNVFTEWTTEDSIERVRRKVQEQYLAIQLEKELTAEGEDAKAVILLNYLNTINLGHSTLGVGAASNRYFNKTELEDLSLSECAVLASIPQNPTKYDPVTNPEENKARRQMVLDKMLDQKMISQKQYDKALADTEDVYKRIAETNAIKEEEENKVDSYFVDALTDQIITDLQKVGYTEPQAYQLVYSGGLVIHSTQDPSIQRIADEQASNSDNYPDSTYYYASYALTIRHPDGSTSNYDANTMTNAGYQVLFHGSREDAQDQAESVIEEYKDEVMDEGDKVDGEALSMVVQPQISLTIQDQDTGYVVALVGGRGQKSANRVLNRATGTTRQPGSTFKIVSTYAPALDLYNYTLASTQYDGSFNFKNADGSEGSTKVNNYTHTYTNKPMRLRQAITESINTVAVQTITCLNEDHDENAKQGAVNAYNFLVNNLGFTTLIGPEGEEINGQIFTDTNQTLALGGITHGVKNIELNAAYAAIANGGTYMEPKLYTTVVDQDGNVLLDTTDEATEYNSSQVEKRAMKKTTAWLLTSAMESVVEEGTGRTVNFGSTSIAGKTGTTSDNRDVWFCGYTPEYTCTVWAGYDNNVELNDSETSLARTMWRAVMERIPANQDYEDFDKPDGLTIQTVCSTSGEYPYNGVCGTIDEYFVEGTQPTKSDACAYHYEKYQEAKRKAAEEAKKKADEEAKKKAEEAAKKAAEQEEKVKVE